MIVCAVCGKTKEEASPKHNYCIDCVRLDLEQVVNKLRMEMTTELNLRKALIYELALPPDITFEEARSTIWPGKSLQEIWDSLWSVHVDVDKYLEKHESLHRS